MSDATDHHDHGDDHADALTRPGPAPRALAAAAAVTVLAGFGVGFVLAGRPPAPASVDTAAVTSTTRPPTGPTTSATAPAPGDDGPSSTAPTTAVPSSTTTSVAPTTATTVAPVTTASPPPTTRAAPVPTVVTTAPPPPSTTTTTAPAPARVVAAWTQDAQGRLVIPRGGSATFTLTNVGGLQTQWLLGGTGFSGPGGTTVRGILDPGQTSAVTVVPAAGLPPGEVVGTIGVLGPNPLEIPFVVP